MRDQHKGKLDLIDEVVGLRKQVDDLKSSAAIRRRIEDALRASEELHRLLVEALPVPVGCLDARGQLVVANQALAELLGYSSRSELIDLGRVLGLFVDSAEEKRVIARLASPTSERRFTACFRLKPGERFPVTLSAVPMPGGEAGAERFALLFEAGDPAENSEDCDEAQGERTSPAPSGGRAGE